MKKKLSEQLQELDRKEQDLVKLKLLKRELSEREFLQNINNLNKECVHYKKLAEKLMKKYKGEKESEGVNESLFNEYNYQNLVLGEYESLLKELESEIRISLDLKESKQEEILFLKHNKKALEDHRKLQQDRLYELQEQKLDLVKKQRENMKYDPEHFK